MSDHSNRILTNYNKRKLEWSLAIYTLWFGGMLMLPPNSMATPAYASVLQHMDETTWGIVYTCVGAAHCTALHINGRAWWTPLVRLAALATNCFVFLGLCMGFAHFDPFSTATLTYGFIGVWFCGAALLTAAEDCGREIAIWRQRHGRN